MRNVGRHVVINHLRLRHVAEIGLGIVVFVNLVDVDNVERAVAERDTGRHRHALDDGFDRPLAALVHNGKDLADAEPRADEQGTLVTPRHLPCSRHPRPQLDLEAGRQLDLLESGFNLFVGKAGRRRQGVGDGGALLRLRLVAHEPVSRRMQPEILAVGIVMREFVGGACAGCEHESRDGNRRRSRDQR
jgi:hypothetical protein